MDKDDSRELTPQNEAPRPHLTSHLKTMTTYVDLSAVQRHLASEGHSLHSEQVDALLRDLGFSPRSPPFSKHNTIQPAYPLAGVAPTGPGVSHCFTSHQARSSPGSWSAKAPTAAGVAALATKLDDLEHQLNAVTKRQSKYEGAGRLRPPSTCTATAAPPADAPSNPLSPLREEMRQLKQDWAERRWTAAAAPWSPGSEDNGSSDGGSGSSGRERQKKAGDGRRRGGSNRVSSKIDPVARYRQLQRIWAKDSFLQSGGDKVISRRKAEGFREAFAALQNS